MGVRFNTDQALFESFPSVLDHVKTPPSGAHPLVFLQGLLTLGQWAEAVAFCAYLLPRRDAVAWGCRSLGSTTMGAEQASEALRAAENWVLTPTEDRRREAYEAWNASDKRAPAHWLALGAAWSGGRLLPHLEQSMPAAPQLTAEMVRLAFLLVLPRIDPALTPARVGQWIAVGARLAEHGL